MKTIKTAMVCILALAAVSVGAQPQHPSQPRQNVMRPIEVLTPEQRAKQTTERLTKELELTEAQQQQVYDLQLTSSKNLNSLMENRKGDMEQMRAEIEKNREAQKAEMKKILTEEQFEKWEKMQADRGGMRGGNSGRQRPNRQ